MWKDGKYEETLTDFCYWVSMTLKHVFNATDEDIAKAMIWVLECNAKSNMFAFHYEPIYEASMFLGIRHWDSGYDVYEEKYKQMKIDLNLENSFFAHCLKKYRDVVLD